MNKYPMLSVMRNNNKGSRSITTRKRWKERVDIVMVTIVALQRTTCAKIIHVKKKRIKLNKNIISNGKSLNEDNTFNHFIRIKKFFKEK